MKFRPLAGFWFLNFSRKGGRCGTGSRLPSPCGVLVLKFGILGSRADDLFSLPSPCGVLVLKFLQLIMSLRQLLHIRPLAGFWFLNFMKLADMERNLSKHPSPCGVLVLKFPRRARPCGIWMKMPFRGAKVLREQKAVSICSKSCRVPRPVSRGADSSPVHGFLRKISRENTAGQSPRRIHIIYCALIESSMNLLPSLAF